jgi:hypothetical protein
MTDQAPITAPTVRCDGWTAARQVQFLDHLAIGGNVRAACARVGMSREAAYRLKRREPLFARAWDAALIRAREASAEVLANRAIDGVEEDVWYKGELVGTRRKYDARLLLAHMARLDKLAEANATALADAERFDELLALVAGEEVPEGLATGTLPLPREPAMAMAGEIAVDDWIETPEDRLDASACAARDRVEAEAGMLWDEWFTRACSTVDGLLEGDRAGALDAVRTVSKVSTSTLLDPPRDGEVADAAGG